MGLYMMMIYHIGSSLGNAMTKHWNVTGILLPTLYGIVFFIGSYARKWWRSMRNWMGSQTQWRAPWCPEVPSIFDPNNPNPRSRQRVPVSHLCSEKNDFRFHLSVSMKLIARLFRAIRLSVVCILVRNLCLYTHSIPIYLISI